ncbi:hypothetical protein NPIL_543361 [Nephila pilipes]|uniref:Uncharacterized protein n=1 Tax=Nephila pilipes TaxID=299642 RepID=A0A8X6U9K8_NEPPI|nr:hypothetical protein NPIL_543361 [Nephila pilipes]
MMDDIMSIYPRPLCREFIIVSYYDKDRKYRRILTRYTVKDRYAFRFVLCFKQLGGFSNGLYAKGAAFYHAVTIMQRYDGSGELWIDR